MKKSYSLIYIYCHGLIFTRFLIYASNCGTSSNKNVGYFGETNVHQYNDGVDSTPGLALLLLADDNEYTFSCCGRIDQWRFRVGNVGDIYLQVWRNTGSTWELVGQNYNNESTSVGETITYDVPTNEEISVSSGDVMAWYSPNLPVISYESGSAENHEDDWYSTTSLSAATTNFNWNSATHADSRDFAIRADMTTPNNPTFTNLDATQSLTNADSVSFTVTATDADSTETLTYSMTSKSGYSFDQSTATVTNTAVLATGTHVFNFQVTDTCGNTDTGTLTLTVTNVPPEINNLPADTDVREDQLTELHLYDINVTDASGDTVTCSIPSASPASTDFIIKMNTVTTTNAIYVKAGASFDYDSVRQYDLTVSCTDQTSSVTGTYIVFIIPNEEPVITNLAATTQVSTTSTTIGDDIFTVTSTDTENDQLHYNMTCVPSGCPFTIYDSGLIECTADLTGHSQAGYDLYVYVYDGYTLVGPRVLTITMTDQNSVPVISNLPLSSALSLQENSAIGTSVFQTQVTDLNLGDNLVYSASYSPTTGASIFQIDTSTGLVSTSANIDYEALSPKTYTVTITVDDGQDSDTESLQISIIDVNEAPVFDFQQYILTGNEGQTGDVIGTPAYGVTDPDSGDTHTYSIDCTSLNIDSSSGQISLATDYDLDISGTSDTISCNVTVSDGALSDTATVIVTLQNVNDNTPTFTFSTYTFYCDSNDGVGTTIGTAAASDADIGTNGDISYSLDQSSLPAEYYGVQQTGEIFIKSDIGYIYNRTDYVFQIIATDTGGMFGTSNVTVICQGYSTLAPINVTERYITFFEDTRNLPWFVVMMAILVSVAAFVAFLLVKAGCCNICRMVEDYFKRRRWNLRRERREQMKNKNRTDSPVSLISASPVPPSPFSLRSTTPRSDVFSQKPSSGIWDPWTNSSDLLK